MCLPMYECGVRISVCMCVSVCLSSSLTLPTTTIHIITAPLSWCDIIIYEIINNAQLLIDKHVQYNPHRDYLYLICPLIFPLLPVQVYARSSGLSYGPQQLLLRATDVTHTFRAPHFKLPWEGPNGRTYRLHDINNNIIIIDNIYRSSFS